MKINENTSAQLIRNQNIDQQNKGEKGNFAGALAEASSRAGSEANPVSSETATNGVLCTSPVGSILAVGGTSPETQVEHVLEQLELYAESLSDPGKSLKDTEPLVNNLQAASERLDKIGEALPDGPMKQITEQTAVLAAVEAEKFKRGDYV